MEKGAPPVLNYAVVSATLGIVFGGCLVAAAALPGHARISLYACFLCLFHFLEFALTARFHPGSLDCKSFLLDHSSAYTASVIAALSEHLLRHWLRPSLHGGAPTLLLGLAAAAIGQTLRTRAMVDAGSSFTHEIASEKSSGHRLVRSGVYAWMRHPSYAGFYLWALGTQLLLGNALCLVAFVIILHKFFRDRIRCEEFHLVEFFPGAYTAYRKQCPSGIPFID